MKPVLLDTNILIHSKNPASTEHTRTQAAIEQLIVNGYTLYVCPQVLRECHKVMTTPVTSNGLGLSPQQARVELQNIIDTYLLTEDSNQSFDRWRFLIDAYNVSGKNVHDTHLVACMLVHNIKDILTYNIKDFSRFNALITVHS